MIDNTLPKTLFTAGLKTAFTIVVVPDKLRHILCEIDLGLLAKGVQQGDRI